MTSETAAAPTQRGSAVDPTVIDLVSEDDRLARALVAEARRLERAAYVTAKGHFEAHGVLSTVHVTLGSLASLGGALAGGGLLVGGAAGTTLTAVAAATATITSSLLTFAKPQEAADKHQTVGTRYSALAGAVHRFSDIDLTCNDVTVEHREQLERFALQKSELDNTGPGVPDYAFHRANRKLRRRHPEIVNAKVTVPQR